MIMSNANASKPWRCLLGAGLSSGISMSIPCASPIATLTESPLTFN
eukprot:CAMPEP_0172315140 /NCGR_PEP_ID=MMETSP1058-20130122/24193_1 /TAXON_ID=83371 /ORGANISM="Detonula confervacea, Strain CCMP 353" /LENGTH=45 /DNA_ID= /DNA_START= /DNA_END= /DNA_ORIENTATION=